MGIEQLIQHIEHSTQEQINELLRRANLVKEREISQAKKQLEKWIERQRISLVREKLMMIAQAKSQVFRHLSLMKTVEEEKIWNDFKQSFIESFKQLHLSEHYFNLLLQIVKNAVTRYGLKSIVMRFNLRDKEYVQPRLDWMRRFLEVEVEMGDPIDCLGGVVVEDPSSGARFVFTIDEIINAWEGVWKARLIEMITSRL